MEKRNDVVFKSVFVLLLMSLAMSGVAFGETDPRGAMSAPPGTAAVIMYYRHIAGHEQFVDGKQASKDYNYSANLSILRPAYWNQVLGVDYNVNLILPYGDKHLKAGSFDQTATGIADPQLVLAFWPVKNWKGFFVQPAVYLTAPLGDYHNDRSINMGANRWAVKPELDLTWRYKDWCIEFMSNIEFYSNNDNYTVANKTSKKDPVTQVQSHISYDINKSFWVALSGWWTWGGTTTNNNVKSLDELSNGTGMLSLNYKMTDNWALLAQYARDFQVLNGPAVDQIRLRLTYVW